MSDFTKSLVTNLGERSVPERANLHCLSPEYFRGEFANSSDKALDWSEILFIKRKGISPDLYITKLVMLPCREIPLTTVI